MQITHIDVPVVDNGAGTPVDISNLGNKTVYIDGDTDGLVFVQITGKSDPGDLDWGTLPGMPLSKGTITTDIIGAKMRVFQSGRTSGTATVKVWGVSYV